MFNITNHQGMQMNYNSYYLTSVRTTIIKRDNNSICDDLEKKGTLLHSLTGNVTWYSHNVEQYGGFSVVAK